MESAPNISSEEELMKLREEGKVSEAEYHDLLAAMRKSPIEGASRTVSARKPSTLQEVPWQIWVVVAFLAVEGAGNLLTIPEQPLALIWLGAKCIFILGLLKGWKWVFCFFVVSCGMHVLFFMLQAPLVALLNLVMIGFAFCSFRFYFPAQGENDDLPDTVQKPPEDAANTSAPVGHKASPRHKSGKIAFYLMLAGIVLPIVSFFVCSAATAGGEMDVIFSGCLFACVLIEMPAFVLGVIAWPDVLGKAAVATISALVLLGLFFSS
ncbi:MAG: hypothetical protein PVJ86_01730 [Phycisphaerales bacterium]|jgi:hypothetical protein